MLKVPYATLPDGTVGFPGTADRSPDWKCPGCKQRVVVKRGSKLTPHFAHHSANTNCSGGESIVHSATKKWVAANVSNPAFRVRSQCYECNADLTVFRGHPSYVGHTEVTLYGPSGQRYQVDAVAVAPNGRIVANIEVFYTSKSTEEKLRVVGAQAQCGAMEVGAVDLVATAYPMEFRDLNRRTRCRPCVVRAVAARKADAVYRRQRWALRASTKWTRAVAAKKAWRRDKYGRRWLLLHRAPKAAAWAAAEALKLHNSMFKPCAKCGADVQTWEWETSKGAKCNTHQLVVAEGWTVDDDQVYHMKCSPNCPECGETRKPGKWCQCQKRAHRKCVDCGKWHKKELMHSNVLPRDQTEWVCDACSSECRSCDARISAKQFQYGGKCYRCNRSAKIVAAGGDPSDGYCTQCGKRLTSSRFEKCYTCYKNNFCSSVN